MCVVVMMCGNDDWGDRGDSDDWCNLNLLAGILALLFHRFTVANPKGVVNHKLCHLLKSTPPDRAAIYGLTD